ncbi:hypothetical protein VNO78_26422 [Psophocarpus tetragonolobus]|uniref:Uncharacterized protein n=1 Tax=Psophocarpus tetragonolobus TaxID=3891 RepID=A0AAN9S096_PSOTE
MLTLMHQQHKGEPDIGEEKSKSHLSSDDTEATSSSTPLHQTHFSIQVSPFSPHPPPPNTPCHHERFSNNPSQASPHKRLPIITLPFPLFPTPFGSKSLTSKLLTRFRFLIFLPLPSLYFLFSNPSPFDFFSVIAFTAALFTSLNFALSFFTRSLSTNLSSSSSAHPVVWSIGSNPKQLKSTSWGCWVQVYSDGDVYEGEFQKGKCWGSGVYHYHNMNGRYEGDWVGGKYDGYGVETWARGSRYRGQYREGLRHGLGIYKFYSGDVYGGEWSNGQCHGFGVHTCNDGSHYVGEFKWGVKHGLGHYHFRNGGIYAGEYFADKMHGFGVYQFQNGHRYEGAWHEGRRQGLGTYTFRNGETQCGHWQNGILDDPIRHNSPTGSPCAVDHAKVFNAVQDAHSAAKKAYNMAKVDDRVNKVVAAANKAANAARVAAVKAVQNRMHHNNNNDK